MADAKQQIIEIAERAKSEEIPPGQAWNNIFSLKKEYVRENSQQSWQKFSGAVFQDIVHSLLAKYINQLKRRSPSLSKLTMLTESELHTHEVLERKLCIKFGEYWLLPDVDSVLVQLDSQNEWQSEIIAIVSSKTSLRERIAQACYWKLKLDSSNITKGIRLFLATSDNDTNFKIEKVSKHNYEGKSRNRVIAEYELDGVYVMGEGFYEAWESDKVKRFEKVFGDLASLARNQP